jgi:hypothetical protein
MFRFARREGGTAVPVRCTGVPLGDGRVRGTLGRRPNEGQSRDIFAALIRAFQSRRGPTCCGSFSVDRCSCTRAFLSRIRAEKPPTEVGGAVQSPGLPLIWLAALAWTTLLATLPWLLLLLTRLLLAAAALLAAWATLTALTAAPVLLVALILLARLLFVGVHICSFKSLRHVTTRALRLSSSLRLRLRSVRIALPSGRLLALPELNFLRGRLCAEPLNER